MFLYPSIWRSAYQSDDFICEEDYQFIETLVEYRNLTFNTQIHGGFGQASLEVFGPEDKTWRRYRDYMAGHLVITDIWGRRVYEGRIGDPVLNPNYVGVTAEGYYAHGVERFQGMLYPFAEGYPVYNTDVLVDCVEATAGTAVSYKTWRQAFAFMVQDGNMDITFLGDDKDYTFTKINDVIEEVLRLGYKETDARALYFAIWGRRTPHLFPAPSVDNLMYSVYPSQMWHISRSNLPEDYSLSRSRDDVWNVVWGLYDGGGGPTHTDPPERDIVSERIYGPREATLNVGQQPQAFAEIAAEQAVETNAYPKQLHSLPVSGIIRHSSGMLDYPWRIKAGDLVALVDLDPQVGLLELSLGGGVSGNVGVVMSTSYSADDNVNRLDVNLKDVQLDMLLSRLGLSGGLA